jgi:hypothetical protein
VLSWMPFMLAAATAVMAVPLAGCHLTLKDNPQMQMQSHGTPHPPPSPVISFSALSSFWVHTSTSCSSRSCKQDVK